MLRAILLVLLIPLFDLVVLAALAQYILGWELTILLVVVTALIGTLLVRAEGRHTVSKLRTKLAGGEIPTDELVDGGLLVLAGVLFLIPGLVTDVAALLIVIPPTRWLVRAAAKKWLLVPYIDAKSGGFATGNVYMGGFPNGNGTGGFDATKGNRAGTHTHRPGEAGSETEQNRGFDGASATDIDFEETDEE